MMTGFEEETLKLTED